MELILINLHALNGHFDRGVRKPLFLPLLRSCGILKDAFRSASRTQQSKVLRFTHHRPYQNIKEHFREIF